MVAVLPKGYKDSPLGAVPADWEVQVFNKAINKLIDFRGRTPKKLGMDWGGGGTPALSANNVKMGFIDFDRECYLGSQELYDSWMTKGDIKQNDIVFTMEAPLGNAALIPDNKKYILSQRVILLRCDSEFYPAFFHQFIMSDKFQDILGTNSTGTTAKGIQQKRLVKLPVVRPPLPEQKKIARILSTVDRKLNLLDQQITATQTLKKGLMQKLFSEGVGTQDANGNWQPHTEFQDTKLGNIPANWGAVPFADVTRQITDGAHHTPTYTESGIPFLRVTDIKGGQLNLTGIKYVSAEEHRVLIKRCNPEKGDILYSKNGTIGVPKAVDWDFEFSIFVSLCLIKLKSSVDKDFVAATLGSYLIHEQIRIQAKQGTVTNLHLEEIRKFKFPVPPIEEQQEIAKILSTADRKLEHLTTQKNQTEQLKKGLMQKLLTGQIRVKLDTTQSQETSFPGGSE